MDERDFMKDVLDGFALPEDLITTVESDTSQYYQHPSGYYEGFFGRLTPKWKNAAGKACNNTDDGAVFSHFSNPLWITKYLGNAEKVVDQPLIQWDGKNLIIPDRPTPEIYFPLFISTKPDDQWKIKNLFQDWKMDGAPAIFENHPSNPAKQLTNVKSLIYYYGKSITFHLTFKASGKGTRYVDGKIGLKDFRPPFEALKAFEEAITAKVEKERAEREANRKANKDVSQPATQTNFDALADGDGFDDFLDT